MVVVLELGLEDEAEPSLTVGICGGCDARNEQALELIVQLPQAGRPSSHLIWRPLHSEHPARDFLWERRAILTISIDARCSFDI